MIDLAIARTDPAAGIDYRCTDAATLADQGLPPYDVICAADSFLDVDDRSGLLTSFRLILARGGKIVFSMPGTAVHPIHPMNWPLAERMPNDVFMAQLLDQLRRDGHPVATLTGDHETFTDHELRGVFALAGLHLGCAGVLRLPRAAGERCSLLAIPAVAKNVFPDLDPAVVRDAVAALILAAELPSTEHTVYAFTARHAWPGRDFRP